MEILNVTDLKVHFPIKKGFFSKTAGYVYAVDGVSFTLEQGKTLCLVGESGCGKTTTGLAILKLVQPTSGKVIFKGQDLSTINGARLRSLRREMQIIFQDPYSSLNPRLTVHGILNDALDIHNQYTGKKRPARIAYLLEKVGLSDEQGRRYPHEFSGGQRQRIGIARALALDPKLIIGDEPVSALDVSIQAQIINLLISLQKDLGLSLIIIAHDLAVVEHIADWVAVMYLGKIVEIGTHTNIYRNPAHPYTQALLSAVPVPDPDIAKRHTILQGDVPSPINPPGGCRFHPRCLRRTFGCDNQEPLVKDLGDGHLVFCHLY